ncbi:MAG: class I SAM-dependent methyltransferase [Clostridia bacterium]|jgi:putative AdoMet-dependent methyltransferase|nr:class I SAM-dependent methyltransferase [Clostridia bacterium]MBT7122981.1 class I SAM-dependent methyltransferase [Clostridia bacterium]
MAKNMVPDWYYNEFEQIGVDFGSVEEVESYDEKRKHFRDSQQELAYFEKAIGLKPHFEVLEIGCGTAALALGLARKCKAVTAIDVSKTMLEYAKEKAREKDVTNISFANAGFLTFESETNFDAIVTQVAFHHLPDFWKMVGIQNMYGLLKDGGVLCLRDSILSFDVKKHKEFVDEYVRITGEKTGEEMANEVKVNITQEYPTLDWIIEGMLRRAGFSIKKVDRHTGYIATFVCQK